MLESPPVDSRACRLVHCPSLETLRLGLVHPPSCILLVVFAFVVPVVDRFLVMCFRFHSTGVEGFPSVRLRGLLVGTLFDFAGLLHTYPIGDLGAGSRGAVLRRVR